MVVGYSLPDPRAVGDYDEFRDAFEWSVPDAYNIAGTVRSAAARSPDRTALWHADEGGERHAFTYAEVLDASAAVAAALDADGIGRGDRVAVSAPPSPEVLALHLGAYRLGAVVVPVSVLLGDEAVGHVLGTTDPAAAWVDTVAAERFGDALPAGSVTTFDLEAGGYRGDRRALGGLAEHVGEDRVDAVADTAPDDPAIVVSTSGTSGDPDCVVQGHRYLLGTLPGYQLWFELFGEEHDERVWTPSSWAWAGALFDVVFPTLAMGGTVCSRVRRSGFDPAAALEFVERAGVSRLFVPPTALRSIRREADPAAADLDLEVTLSGGEFLPRSLQDWAEDALGCRINVSYGLTEANALVGHCRALFPDRGDSIGRPYPGHGVHVVGEDGDPVPPGEAGELVLDLPDPVALLGHWTEDGFRPFEGDRFATGDLAVRDEDGYVFYEGRADEVIVTSGYRVSPREVEAELAAGPAVSEAAVGGVRDDRYGRRIVAYVVPADGADGVDPDALVQRVRDRLGKYKAPHEVVERESLPRTHSGKVDRGALFPD